MNKKEKLYNAITEIDDDLIVGTAKAGKEKKKKVPVFIRAAYIAAATAAVVAIAFLGKNIITGGGIGSMKNVVYAGQISVAKYPELTKEPDYEGEYIRSQHEAYYNERNQRNEAFRAVVNDFKSFCEASSGQILLDNINNDSVVYSPANVYLALCMLAECTDGNSREQLLNALNASDINALRVDAKNLWTSAYTDDGHTKSLLANSVWLSDALKYKKETLDVLANDYFASSFKGTFGSEEYNKVLRQWLNDQTGNLLTENVENLEFQPETVLALASTLYFKAKWSREFDKEETYKQMFYGIKKDTEIDFLHSNERMYYYDKDGFDGIYLGFNDGSVMFVFLPEEGKDVKDLINNQEVSDIIFDPYMEAQYLKVDLSLPIFDVTGSIDLVSSLKSLGVEDVFTDTADFSPIVDGNAFVSKIEHTARVKIDEEGCEAAAYTILLAETSAMLSDDDVVEFVVDRPFMFVIRGQSGVILFNGIVNQL